MARSDITSKYPLLLRILHWSIAALIVEQLILGWYMVPYQEGQPIWDKYYYFHKSFGVLVFLLIVFRLLTRWRSKLQELPLSLPSFDRKLAKIAHVLLYVLMFTTPIFGYLLSSSYKFSDGVYLFSLFKVPEILPKNDAAYEVFDWAHAISAYTLLAVVILHICGALKHRFFDTNKENDVLSRML